MATRTPGTTTRATILPPKVGDRDCDTKKATGSSLTQNDFSAEQQTEPPSPAGPPAKIISQHPFLSVLPLSYLTVLDLFGAGVELFLTCRVISVLILRDGWKGDERKR